MRHMNAPFTGQEDVERDKRVGLLFPSDQTAFMGFPRPMKTIHVSSFSDGEARKGKRLLERRRGRT